MQITIKLNKQAIKKIENAVHESAVEAMESLNKDLNDSQTVPFDTGNMQNNETFVCDESDDDNKRIYVKLENSADQSRYLYHGVKMVDSETGKGPALVHDKHGAEVGYRFRKGAKLKVKKPEEKLTFQKGRTDHWLEPYISGNKKDFIKNEFEKNLKGKI